jgi:hypothetical protein
MKYAIEMDSSYVVRTKFNKNWLWRTEAKMG